MILVVRGNTRHLTELNQLASRLETDELKFVLPNRFSDEKLEFIDAIWIEIDVMPQVLHELAKSPDFSGEIIGFGFKGEKIWRTTPIRFSEWENSSVTLEENFGHFIVASGEMKRILENAQLLARSNSSVLITGETGTGKELLADYIYKHSTRQRENFIRLNCATIPYSLFEAELFGYRKGAFTGALRDNPGKFILADRGTLFLDEIGEIPVDSQAKLLRVLDYGLVEPLGGIEPQKVDVRIIAATNKDLNREVQRGHFRQDLYYRLGVFQLTIPPLRERPEDILALFDYFIQKNMEKHKKNVTLESKKSIHEFLLGYHWPGNVRELKSLAENLIVFCEDDTIRVSDMERLLNVHKSEQEPKAHLKWVRMKSEKEKIIASLVMHNYHITRTADYLGISRIQLYRKMKKYGIENRKRKNDEDKGTG